MNYVIKGKEMEPREYPYYAENLKRNRVYIMTSPSTGVLVFSLNAGDTTVLGLESDCIAEWLLTPLPKGTVLEVTL